MSTAIVHRTTEELAKASTIFHIHIFTLYSGMMHHQSTSYDVPCDRSYIKAITAYN